MMMVSGCVLSSLARAFGDAPFLALARMPAFWAVVMALGLPASFALAFAIRRWSRARAGRVTFLDHAIAFTKPGAAFIVPWSWIAGFDDRSIAFVQLHLKDERFCSTDHAIPTPDEDSRARVLELLASRGIPGDGARLGGPRGADVSQARIVLSPRVPPWVVRIGSLFGLAATVIVLIALADRTWGLSCLGAPLLVPIVALVSHLHFDLAARAELHDDRVVLFSGILGGRGRRRAELVYEDLRVFDARPRGGVRLSARSSTPLYLPLAIPTPTIADKEAVVAWLRSKGLAEGA